MRSIRFSLIVYFVVLLLAALGGISYFCYQSTQQALEAKEISTRELFKAKYKENCAQARIHFDRGLLFHAKAAALKFLWVSHQPEPLYSLGLINTNLSFQGHLQVPLWLNESFPGNLRLYAEIARSRPFDIRLARSEEDMPRDDEYFQINAPRRAPGEIRWIFQPAEKSDNLPEWFVFDEDLRQKAADSPAYFDDVKLSSGIALRRVTLKTSIAHQNGFMPSTMRFPGTKLQPKLGWPPGRDDFRSVYLQFATQRDQLHRDLAALKDNLDRELAELEAGVREALADLRTRMLWIGIGAFAALVIGGFALVRVGLSPLNRLSEAVRNVSPRDFRLPIDQQNLPNELKPIAARLQETLGELKRVFSREKQSVADISHELRTPVAALLATLEVALKKPRAPEEYREFLADCRTAGQQMSQLVERLLALARLDAGVDQMRPRDVDMAEVVRQCANLVRPLAEARGVNLRLHLNGPVPLRADPDKLREILTNLLHNAIEYNKPHGSIDLALERQNGHVRVEVRDTGIGIPPEMREHIFERFYRGDPSRHSEDGVHAGLGLAIVKGYVDLMGGTIGVESTSAGSTFRVDLPIRDTPASRGA